jgi:predicted nucleic acid-binding protein
VSGCVLDTDVVIGALDRRDAHHRRASADLLAMLEGGTSLFLSVINYAEALVRPAEAEETLAQAVAAIAALRIDVHQPDAAIGREAASLRAFNISLADGFALATARRLGASVASYDIRVRRAATRAGIDVA